MEHESAVFPTCCLGHLPCCCCCRCHVMEHESFESEETAAIMNKHFINIKVGRCAAGSCQKLSLVNQAFNVCYQASYVRVDRRQIMVAWCAVAIRQRSMLWQSRIGSSSSSSHVCLLVCLCDGPCAAIFRWDRFAAPGMCRAKFMPSYIDCSCVSIQVLQQLSSCCCCCCFQVDREERPDVDRVYVSNLACIVTHHHSCITPHSTN
jgi:hypothetical protein